jgi:hypothetical protein
MPRKPIGDRPMTDAERQARHRAARDAGKPIIRIRRPSDLRSRAQRWRDAVAVLVALQEQYIAWQQGMPPNLNDSATAQALQVVCELDLSELQAVEPPRGFGRD